MRIRSIVLSLLLLTSATAAMRAQRSETSNAAEADAVKQMVQLVFQYWTPKLNDYYRFVNRSLSPSDLTQLNNLRLRFEFLMDAAARAAETRRLEREAEAAAWRSEQPLNDDSPDVSIDSSPEYSSLGGGASEDRAFANTEVATAPPAVERSEDVASSNEERSESVGIGDAVGADPSNGGVFIDDDPYDESTTVGIGMGADVRQPCGEDEGEMVADDSEPSGGHAAEDHLEIESKSILMSTASLAARYGTMSDMLRKRVAEDLAEFVGIIVDKIQELQARNPELGGPDEAELAQILDLSKRRELAEQVLSGIWNDGRSFIMLYNGQGIASILAGLGVDEVKGIDVGTASTGDEFSAVGQSAVMQNSPNPASTTTTIAFRLAESSAETRLKIFDATGHSMASVDLGALGAGEHESVVDVAEFPAGSYVYHLTARSSMGEEVFSRVMQVVR